MMLKLFHVPGTRSARIIWLCEELGLPLDIEVVSFSPEFRMGTKWLKKNPVGKVPVLEDGELSMFESGAMVQYILDRYGKGRLQPVAGTLEHALYMQWSWFGEATFARPLGEIVNHRRNFDPEIPAVVEEMKSRALLCVKAVNNAVEGREFLLGGFTAADIMVGYCLMLCDRLIPNYAYEATNQYWARLCQMNGAVKAFSDLDQGPLSQ
jgi:glutathione S-transferase